MKGPDRYLPHMLGHEGSGVVVKVGAGVTKVRPGDRVVLTWIKGEGADSGGAVYRTPDGVSINSGPISTFARCAIVSENRVVVIDPDMPLREAALLGCAVPTGAGVVLNTAKVKRGSSVAVFGLGGVGLSAVLGAMMAGAAKIIVVDVADEKLKLAMKLGATDSVNAGRSDAVAAVRELTGRAGADYAFEATGQVAAMEAAFQSVRDDGGLCVIAGNAPSGRTLSLNPMDLIRGKRIMGTWGGGTSPDRDIPTYVRYYLDGKLELTSLITHRYQLQGVNDALADLEAGKVGRGILEFEN